ncbi:hypothetical protein ACTFIW_003782 [Dictyostelium discoideum]
MIIIKTFKVYSTAKLAAEVTFAYDNAIAVKAKSKRPLFPLKTMIMSIQLKKEPKKSKTNSIETKTIDALKNAATAVIFMNLFTIRCTQNGVDPTLKTIMDNGAASNELLQLLQPTHNESVKNTDFFDRVRRNNIAKEIYDYEVLLPIKIKGTQMMFDETKTETERLRKLTKSIRNLQTVPTTASFF